MNKKDIEKINNMSKSELRYRLYRKRTEVLGGAVYDLEPDVLDYVEQTENFLGWEKFAMLWDVKKVDDEWVSVPLTFSEFDKWNAKLRTLTEIIPMKRKKANKLSDE